MKDFTSWGIKRRHFPEYNYNAIWNNLKTIRLGEGTAKALPPQFSEFYDIGLGTKCQTGNCPFCYVSANPSGRYFKNICETWKKWMSTFNDIVEGNLTNTLKPFQIAIGSTGEPTEHPEFCEFLKTVYESGVVPNYTTNGVILSDWNKPEGKYYSLALQILDYTKNYIGGVAVSFGNPILRNKAKNAIEGLIKLGECKINIHHIISDKESVDEFIQTWKNYGSFIDYHVLLPLMPSGRSKTGIEPDAFEYLENQLLENNIDNVAFGAHFIEQLKSSKIKTWLYPPESLSKNIILEENKIIITPSSFDLSPIHTIEL